MVNFSVVGRDCSVMERENYFKWDDECGERKSIVSFIKEEWPELDASSGGQISIDIHIKGRDKSQVIDRISGNNIFFGDKCFQGGNDHKIALKSDRYHHVDGWQETKDILEKFYG